MWAIQYHVISDHAITTLNCIYKHILIAWHKTALTPKTYLTIPKMHQLCTFLLQNGTLWDVILVHCGMWDWCIVGLWIWSNELAAELAQSCTKSLIHRDSVDIQWPQKQSATHFTPEESHDLSGTQPLLLALHVTLSNVSVMIDYWFHMKYYK